MKRAVSDFVLGVSLCATLGFANPYPEVGLHPGYTLMGLRPTGFQPQVTGMDFMPNGDMIVLTWRGQSGPGSTRSDGVALTQAYTGTTKLYRLTNTQGTDFNAIKVTEIGSGFKDAQGLCIVDSQIYVGDIDRVVKMVDKDGDGKYETQQEIGKIPSYMGWFEYSFGPVYKGGKLYMALASNVKTSGYPEKAIGKDRGTLVSLPIGGGVYSVVATGLRAPDGIAIGPDGNVWVTDNQGGWRPSSQFIDIQEGRFYGYLNDGESMPSGAKVTPPNLWAPYRDANDSPTEPALMTAGPFKGQFVYGDVGRGGIYRAYLEKVNGEYQGSMVSFSGGLECGVHRIRTGPNGEIYMGGIGNGGDSNQGWNGKTFGLQKLTPNGTLTFEILATHSRSKGMELEFTLPVGTDGDKAANYVVKQWGYTPVADYGLGKGTETTRTVKAVQVSTDRKRVYLEIDGLKTGNMVGITISNVKSQDGAKALWYNKTWYTLNSISPSQAFEIPVAMNGAPAGPLDMQVSRFADRIGIRLPGAEEYQVELLDFQGRLVGEQNTHSGSAEIRLPRALSGLHILRAHGDGKTIAHTLVF
jgi:hypothetical protein